MVEGRGWNNRLYEFQQIQPEIILPQQPTRLNRWQSVWYFVENEDDDQKRFPDNGFIAIKPQQQHGWKAAKAPFGVWATI